MRRTCTIRTPRRPSAFYKPPAPFRATKPASRGTCRATAVCARLLQGTRPNPRAARPVAERRYFRSQLARLPNTPASYGRGAGSRAARGRRKAGCPWDNPVCLWQTELFKFYLKSSPSPSGHNRRRRLATGSRQPKRGFDTAVSKTTIEVADHYPLLSRRWPARWCCSRRKPSDKSRRPLPYRSPC